jgi:uracil-DNA glycosylase
MLKTLIHTDWKSILEDTFEKDYFNKLEIFVENAYLEDTIYPPKSHIFEAFNHTPYTEVKVVILGQDPYHGENQAMGLSFSVPSTEKLPPSLRNIYKELYDDVKITRMTGDLTDWAEQGVLLLNDVLTVKAKTARSHRGKGWEVFTLDVIEKLNMKDEPIVYVLWGNDAIKKEKYIADHHHIVKGPHPSPLSSYRGFFGSKPFSKINELLKTPIKW